MSQEAARFGAVVLKIFELFEHAYFAFFFFYCIWPCLFLLANMQISSVHLGNCTPMCVTSANSWTGANSPRANHHLISSLCFLPMPTYTHQQSRRRRSSIQHVLNAASSRNLGKSVAAVAVVLGSETVEVPLTRCMLTRGTRVYRPAKHWRSPKQPSADSQTRLNSETPLMGGLAWQTRKQSLHLQIHLR